jgi:radical SAM protein with 4Fe4S-binding SPASM domain
MRQLKIDSSPPTSNPYNEILARTSQQHRLFSVHWELTYRCNERCSHCYLNVLSPDADTPEELTTSECLRVLDELAALGVLNLTFSGGEIFVRRDLLEIARHAHAARFLLRLFTNGIAITPVIADHIAELHPYAVEISLYSTHPEIHENITGRQRSFELTTRALRLLHERGVRTVMKTPLIRENIRELHGLEAFARDLGAQFRYDFTITPKDDGSCAPLRHRLTYDDWVWLFRETLDVTMWSHRDLQADEAACNIAGNALAIDPYGNVMPCVQVRALVGNVHTRSLKEIWQESPVWPRLRAMTWDKLCSCRDCTLRSMCIRCHGLARLEDDDIWGPASVNCLEALARRHVLVEKGALPANYPIPFHLRELATHSGQEGRAIPMVAG